MATDSVTGMNVWCSNHFTHNCTCILAPLTAGQSVSVSTGSSASPSWQIEPCAKTETVNYEDFLKEHYARIDMMKKYHAITGFVAGDAVWLPVGQPRYQRRELLLIK